MTLSKEEIFQIESIVQDYRSIHKDLSYYESSLERLEKGLDEKSEERVRDLGFKIKSCIESLNQKRILEKEFLSSISEKYGPGEIDIQTLQYKIKK